ncbi:hypothetical protein ACWF94_32625 [Streptomyces sp. NPDC055078]
MTALLGLGTYRIAGEELAAAAQRAASSPSGWIDTAPNYCHGRAHRLLAPVLADFPLTGLATKAGFLTRATARSAGTAAAHAPPVPQNPHAPPLSPGAHATQDPQVLPLPQECGQGAHSANELPRALQYRFGGPEDAPVLVIGSSLVDEHRNLSRASHRLG